MKMYIIKRKITGMKIIHTLRNQNKMEEEIKEMIF
jgi:hypothetical protein